MDPNNQNYSSISPEVEAASAKKSPMQMISSLFSNLKKKPTPTPSEPGSENAASGAENKEGAPANGLPKSKFPKVSRKVVVIIAALVLLAIVIMVVVGSLGKNKGRSILPNPTPSPAETEAPVEELPSQYADDEDVFELKSNLMELDQQLNDASFRDETLRIPSLDWNVSFK